MKEHSNLYKNLYMTGLFKHYILQDSTRFCDILEDSRSINDMQGISWDFLRFWKNMQDSAEIHKAWQKYWKLFSSFVNEETLTEHDYLKKDLVRNGNQDPKTAHFF